MGPGTFGQPQFAKFKLIRAVCDAMIGGRRRADQDASRRLVLSRNGDAEQSNRSHGEREYRERSGNTSEHGLIY
jgi:hypothetical protein